MREGTDLAVELADRLQQIKDNYGLNDQGPKVA
jgi:hypothetical protein